MYYIVYEVYVDISENVHETNEIYAIDVNTADLFKAYKADEGVYHLQPLEQNNEKKVEIMEYFRYNDKDAKSAFLVIIQHRTLHLLQSPMLNGYHFQES